MCNINGKDLKNMNEYSYRSWTAKKDAKTPTAKIFKVVIVLIPLVILMLFIFKVPMDTILPFGLLLACPLMHLFMLKDDNHRH